MYVLKMFICNFRQVAEEEPEVLENPEDIIEGSDDDELRQIPKDLPGKVGKKKMEKMQAKADKKLQREAELQVRLSAQSLNSNF